MKYTYIVSWTIFIISYTPCKEQIELHGGLCSETDQKQFSIGFLNRDSAILVYKTAIINELKPRFDSIQNK